MSFLAPLFLLGALAVALPVVFHLIRRTTRERTLFSSLLFLTPSPPRLTRRSRLEHLLLLLLRCLALCLLAFGFARPFVKQALRDDLPAGPVRRLVVLVDTSASMRRTGLWTAATTRTERVIGRAAPADEVAVFTFDRQIRPLVTFDDWAATPLAERAALVRRRLAETAPGWAGTDMGQALTRAAEALGDIDRRSPLASRQIVLISDLQEGSRLEPLQSYEWPKDVALIVEPITARLTTNAGLQLVSDDDANPPPDAAVRVRVSNAADSQREQFRVGWTTPNRKELIGTPVEVYVPPGQSRIATVPAPPPNARADCLSLQGDDEDFDNTVFVLPAEKARFRVLYLGREAERDTRQPLYFLFHAFQETRRLAVQVLARSPDQPVAASEAEAATLLVLTDPLPPEQVPPLRRWVAAGKTLWLAPKNAAALAVLKQLLGRDDLLVEEAPPRPYAMLADIDFSHPLFAPFADPRFSDFTKIHFWRYRRLNVAGLSGARVVARFDTGDPALVELPVGQGRVLILTSCWHPDDSQLALSSKFVPLVYALLEQAGANPLPAQYRVGDTVPLERIADGANRSVTVRTPEGSELTLPAGVTNFTQTLVPGFYTLTSAQPPRQFVVNLDVAESRTAPMPLDTFERLGAPVPRPEPDRVRQTAQRTRLLSAEIEGRQRLWRWFILGTLLVVLVESLLAGWTARQSARGEVTV